MTFAGWAQLVALIVVLGVTAPLLGRYMAKVYDGGPSRLDRVFGPVERLIYRACRIDPEREQRWNVYAFSLLAFSVVGFFLLYVMQRVQSGLPFNPTDMANVQPALSFNTAVSFVTNTNWQSYAGETHDEPPHPDGGSHGAELRVGRRRHGGDGRADPRPRPGPGSARSATSGSTSIRTTFRILLPIAFVFAIVLIATGVIQNTHGFTDGAHGRRRDAADPGRPERQQGVDQAARDERRRLLQRQLRAPVLEPDGLQRLPRALRHPDHPVRAHVHVRADGQGQAPGLRRARGHGRASGWRSASVAIFAEVDGNPKLDCSGVTQTVTATSPGGNVEGKEVRFGPVRLGGCGARRRPARRTARSTRCTTATRRSAG